MIGATRRPVEVWLLPPSLCDDRVPHPPHGWRSEWGEDGEGWWCRGRMPFTLAAAAAGMVRVRTLRQADGWREMCGRTPGGRAFLCTPEWRRLYQELRAAEEQQAAVPRPRWRWPLGAGR